MLIIGTRLFTWGSAVTAQAMHCASCGTVAHFFEKTAMRFVTLFFIIPTIPISGKMHIVECPRCRTRYQANPNPAAFRAPA